MKKIFFLILILLTVIGCTRQPATKIQINGIEEIHYEKLIQNLNSNVKFILYIGRPDCGDCQEFYPILEEYINNHEGSGIYYLNIKEFRDRSRSEDASQQEKDFYENLYEELHFDWTPTIHIIENGKFIDTYQYLDEDYIEMTDRKKQIERRQAFLEAFEKFMNKYFEEDL